MSTGGGWVVLSRGGTTELVLSGSDTIEVVEQLRWHNWDGSQWHSTTGVCSQWWWQNSGGGTTDLTRWAAAFGEAASGEERLRRGGANQQWNIFTWIPSSLHPAAWILSGSHLDSQQLKFSPESHLVPRSSNWIPPKFNPNARFLMDSVGKVLILKGWGMRQSHLMQSLQTLNISWNWQTFVGSCLNCCQTLGSWYLLLFSLCCIFPKLLLHSSQKKTFSGCSKNNAYMI